MTQVAMPPNRYPFPCCLGHLRRWVQDLPLSNEAVSDEWT